MNLKFTEFRLKNDKVLNKINFNLSLIQDLDYYIDNIEDNIYWSTTKQDSHVFIYLYIGVKDRENYFLKCEYFYISGLEDITIIVKNCEIIKDDDFGYSKIFDRKPETIHYR